MAEDGDGLKREYLDKSEFYAAMDALGPTEILRLAKRAAYYAPGTGMSGEDLLHEAITRTLEDGRRHCPADVAVDTYLGQAIRSISNGEREKYERETPVGTDLDEDGPISTLADPRTPTDTVLNCLELDHVVDRLQELFSDDPQAQAVVIGDMEGWSPSDVREMECMSDTEYATARRRVRRIIEREFGKRDH